MHKGWINMLYQNESPIQEKDMTHLYTSSFYWIITTFTTVGYGDIKGDTELEYLFQIMVELVGIGFFGYMTGVLQEVIIEMSKDDYATE